MPEELTNVRKDIRICHESFGDRDDPSLLLIMGLGTQMVGWHDDFCGELANRGFHVVRFDNRDTGRSTHMRFRPPHLGQIVTRRFHPRQYRLEDMADDTAGLIEKLDLGPVHVVGASMGGMVAQTLAIRQPQITRSLTSIMSNTGSRLAGQPALSLLGTFLRKAPTNRQTFIDYCVEMFRVIGSTELGFDEDEIREIAARSYDRGHSHAGTGRQLGAILKSGNRTDALRRLELPTTVIHGTADKLIQPSGGRATAKAIRDARLIEIQGMGHDLPRAAWPRIMDAIAENVRRAGGPSRPLAGAR